VDCSDFWLPACTEFLLESSSFFFFGDRTETSITMSAFSAESTRMYRPQLSKPASDYVECNLVATGIFDKDALRRSKTVKMCGGGQAVWRETGAGVGCWDQLFTVQKISRPRPARVVCESERPMIHCTSKFIDNAQLYQRWSANFILCIIPQFKR